jgi:hypothetical protein
MAGKALKTGTSEGYRVQCVIRVGTGDGLFVSTAISLCIS